MEKQYQNIPDSGFSIIDQSNDKMIVRVEAFKEGVITLSPFSIFQILEGAEYLPELQEGKSIPASLFKVYVKLNSAFRKVQLGEFGTRIEFFLTRYEILLLIRLLKARMKHCEWERDKRITVPGPNGEEFDKFNPDTYIGQKLLLLELTELLMGTILD